MHPESVGDASMLSEYLCTLQPPEGSALALKLSDCRAACRMELGVDETGLYPPHITVTGFFSATPQQAARVCDAVAALVHRWEPHRLTVEVRRVVTTETGHVILDVFAPGVADLAAALAAQAESFGIRLRPKAVRHLSLASRRNVQERESVARLHAGVPLGRCELDLVVSRLLERSDTEGLRGEGRAHVFSNILRLRLPSDMRIDFADQLRPSLKGSGTADVATPMRKRRLEPQEPLGECGDATPPKVPAPRAGPLLERSKVQRLS